MDSESGDFPVSNSASTADSPSDETKVVSKSLPDLPLDVNVLREKRYLPNAVLNSLFTLSKKNETIEEGLTILQNLDRRVVVPKPIFLPTDQGISALLKKTRLCIK